MSQPGGALMLELTVPSQWARIDRVSQAVAGCVSAVFADSDLRDALRMTCAELLENAIKYGTPGSSIRVALFDRPEEIVIEVTNSVTGAVGEAMRQRIAWIDGFPSPAAAYAAALEAVAARDASDREGGLGLARIAYEGGCTLRCHVVEPGTLTVRAHHVIAPPLASANEAHADARRPGVPRVHASDGQHAVGLAVRPRAAPRDRTRRVGG